MQNFNTARRDSNNDENILIYVLERSRRNTNDVFECSMMSAAVNVENNKKLFSTDISSDHEGISTFQINIVNKRH
jgi:hypothetical protein